MADDKKEKKKAKKKKEEEGGGDAAPNPGSGGGSTKSSAKRAKRTGSSVFSMFSQRQVQEFKEAFQLMDANKDGFLDKNDLRSTYDSLGRIVNDKDLDEMLSEAPGPITFTLFLSIFGDRISGSDEEDVIQKAFGVYDEGDGKCKADKLKHDLMTWGEKFSQEEIDDAFEQAPIDGDGNMDVKKFANILTKGVEDEDDQAAA
uniref:Myosin light chain 2 n=1 Tax=Scolopendra subspinipes TaxID=55038 RepID=B6V746_SCOSU|nr:myosin light chain 2 [Scolopendra subspinipes]